MTAYVTARRVAKVSASLTTADWQLLEHLEAAKLLSGRQLYSLDGDTIPNRRRVQRQLKQLTEIGIITRLNRRVGGIRSGSDSFIYALDILGQRLLDDTNRNRWRRPWTPSSHTLKHALAVSELYVQLIEAEPTGQLEVESFTTEPTCWRSFVGPGGARMTLKPDAHLILGVDDHELHAWIEMDLATESLPWITEKAKTYGRYFATGKEQTINGVFPKALWIAPNQERAMGLVSALSRLPADDWQLHQVTTAEHAIDALTQQQQPVSGEPRT